MWLERVDKMELIEYPNTLKCKLGFFDFILRKWFCNPFTDEGDAFRFLSLFETKIIFENLNSDSGSVDMMMDSNEDYLAEEMEKQKKKLRDISNVLDSQHQLLRLIIQVKKIRKH